MKCFDILTTKGKVVSTIKFNKKQVIKLTKSSALTIGSPLRIVLHKMLTKCMFKFDRCLDLRGLNPVNLERINMVDMTMAGRHLLNSFTEQNDWNFDMLTKRDLILIWNKCVNTNKKIDESNFNVRLIRGIGDIIIDWVINVLEDVLFSRIQILEPDLVIKRIAMLFNRHQRSIDKLFNQSELVQHLEQLNSLTKLDQKLRVLNMRSDGVSIRTTGTSSRYVQKWHLGKLCPIESPEGQNIGLVLSLALHTSFDVDGQLLTTFCIEDTNNRHNKISHLNYYNVGRYSEPIVSGSDERFIEDGNSDSKQHNVVRLINKAQVFSPVVNLIPFLTHNDPTRALMATNMLKQAIPLTHPQPPLIGTGLESSVMAATNDNITAKCTSVVMEVDGTKVTTYNPVTMEYYSYPIPDTTSRGQNGCERFRSVVKVGQIIKQGDVVAECQSSSDGEMSLGVNLLAAIMC